MAGVLDPFRDQLINPRPKIGGGVGGLIVATRSDNSQPAVFADFAALEVYAATTEGTADAARINVTEQEDAREVFAVGTLTSGEVTTVTAAYIRLNGDWVAVATNLIGAQGPAGPQGDAGTDGTDGAGIDFNNTTGNTILRMNAANNVIESSSMEDQTDQVDITKMIRVPDASGVMFGGIQVLNGGFNIAAVTLDNRTFFPIATELQTSGSAIPLWIKFEGETTTPSPANKTETFTGTNIQFKVINSNDGLATAYTFDAVSAVTDVNLIIRATSHTSDDVIFDYKRATGGTGFNLNENETQITLPGIGLFFRENQELYVTIAPATGNISLRGQTIDVGGTDETFPYAAVLGRESTDISILTLDAGQLAALPLKASPIGADIIMLEDSEDSNSRKYSTIQSLPIATVPSLHNLAIDIPSRVDLNTDLNVQHTVTFDITNHSHLSAITLIVTTGDNKTLTLPVRDGSQSQTVTLSGIDTSSAGTVTFQLSGTRTGGAGTVVSNIVTINVQDLQSHEFAYYGFRPTDDFASVSTGSLSSADVSSSGSTYSISVSVANEGFLGILSPDNRDPVSIIETTLNTESLSDFTATATVRTINNVDYNLLTIQNNSGFTGTFSFNVTTE